MPSSFYAPQFSHPHHHPPRSDSRTPAQNLRILRNDNLQKAQLPSQKRPIERLITISAIAMIGAPTHYLCKRPFDFYDRIPVVVKKKLRPPLSEYQLFNI